MFTESTQESFHDKFKYRGLRLHNRLKGFSHIAELGVEQGRAKLVPSERRSGPKRRCLRVMYELSELITIDLPILCPVVDHLRPAADYIRPAADHLHLAADYYTLLLIIYALLLIIYVLMQPIYTLLLTIYTLLLPIYILLPGLEFRISVSGVQCHLNHLTILRRFSWPSLAYMCTKVA